MIRQEGIPPARHRQGIDVELETWHRPLLCPYFGEYEYIWSNALLISSDASIESTDQVQTSFNWIECPYFK